MTEKEIGSFIELQFAKGKEFYKGDTDIIRLNSGRCAILHAFRLTNCTAIWIPYYQCESVRNFLNRNNVRIKYYHINNTFAPLDLDQQDDEAVLLVNYYGIMSYTRMQSLSSKFNNVIIDNSQAFFAKPNSGCLNVYSARKFIGVPDGAYVIGPDAEKFAEEYSLDYSSDTALFLLQRIEYGCAGKAYESRLSNEKRIENASIMKMSKLTSSILDGTDYPLIITKRKENFKFARELFDNLNKLNVGMYYDESCIPMVYPLLIEKEDLLDTLLKCKHFQGHWWGYVLNEVAGNSTEYWISKYMMPITIDQRYDKDDLLFIWNLIINTI